MKPILLFPVRIDAFGREEFRGIEFESFQALRANQSNAQYKRARIIVNGAVYDVSQIGQAIADTMEHEYDGNATGCVHRDDCRRCFAEHG